MPNYKVRNPISYGKTDDEGNFEVKNYAEGDDLELSKEDAQPLLDSGAIVQDDTDLTQKEDDLAELQEEVSELEAKVNALKQSIREQQEELSRNPNLEFGGLVAAPQAAAPKAGDDDYNDQTRAKLAKLARERGISPSGTKGDIVNRLRNQDIQDEDFTPASQGLPEADENTDDPDEPQE